VRFAETSAGKAVVKERLALSGVPNVSDGSRYTIDHGEIRRWIEKRGGRPAALGKLGRRIAGLRVDFPQYRIKAALRPITWGRFFDAFESARWGFIYQEENPSGELSHFYRFVERDDRDRTHEPSERSSHRAKAT
jgi:hypothetical protein